MPYYHDLITQKSWELLQEFKRKHRFILIGGWAVYLYSKQLKSKDIDVIVVYKELENLRAHHELTKNDRLRKYEIHIDGIDIDIYVPFFSDLGLPIEAVQERTVQREGFILPTKEVLLVLKQKAWLDRGHSLKGEKDRIDIIGLVASGMDWRAYGALLSSHKMLRYAKNLADLLKDITEVPELNLNAHQYAKLKREALAGLS